MSRKQLLALAFILFSGCLLIGCFQSGDPKPVTATRSAVEDDPGNIDALPAEVVHPADNPSSPEKIELGRLLFFDPVLSGSKDIACATCHHPEFGYAENIELSIGVSGEGLGEKRFFRRPGQIPFTRRNSQSVLNTAFNGIDDEGKYDPSKAPMFWDLRSKSLEDQALHPIRQFEEMRGDSWKEDQVVAEVVSRLKAIPEYRKRFKQVFNEPEPLNETNLAKAIACYERSLIANNSKFDRYMRNEGVDLTSSEQEGMELFLKAGCARCHNGPMFSDFKVHTLGAPDNEKLTTVDSGFNGTFAFRTPTLRNLRYTAPYMHSGKIQTLENVLTFYEDLRGKPPRSVHVHQEHIDSLAQKVKLDFKDISRILEFLNTLNDGSYDKTIPVAVPSRLPVGGNIQALKN